MGSSPVVKNITASKFLSPAAFRRETSSVWTTSSFPLSAAISWNALIEAGMEECLYATESVTYRMRFGCAASVAASRHRIETIRIATIRLHGTAQRCERMEERGPFRSQARNQESRRSLAAAPCGRRSRRRRRVLRVDAFHRARQVGIYHGRVAGSLANPASARRQGLRHVQHLNLRPVSYTHLRAHETG